MAANTVETRAVDREREWASLPRGLPARDGRRKVDSSPRLRPERKTERVLKDSPAQTDLARAHGRFARAALGIYLGSALLALAVLIAFFFAARVQEEDQRSKDFLKDLQQRESNLRRHVGLLVQDLRRLSLRTEVDLLDQNPSPELQLLQLSHEGSAFFDLGVAIIDRDGNVRASVPENFLTVGRSLATTPWFDRVRVNHELTVAPVRSEDARPAAVYIAAPIIRNGHFSGAVIGGTDLAKGEGGPLSESDAVVKPVLATHRGHVLYPAPPPQLTHDPAWHSLFLAPTRGATLTELGSAKHHWLVAAAEVRGTDLSLLLLAEERALFSEVRTRLRDRIILALLLASLPILALVWMLRRSLQVFRVSGERLIREERLRRVGEASNLIAHEVKNALNGIRMAAELACDTSGKRSPVQERALSELRSEIARLANFTAELMTFSKGINVRANKLELGDFLAKVISLAEKVAVDSGVQLSLKLEQDEIFVQADPQLLHVVVFNLVTNAIDAMAASATSSKGHVVVTASETDSQVLISVKDNGPGVSPSMVPRLFEPFESGKASGVGIGLALAQRIAEAHGGRLSLASNADGATFVLTLPKPAPSPKSQQSTTAGDSVHEAPRTAG